MVTVITLENYHSGSLFSCEKTNYELNTTNMTKMSRARAIPSINLSNPDEAIIKIIVMAANVGNPYAIKAPIYDFPIMRGFPEQ